METRKLQVVGSRSFSLSLPKQWVTDNKLKNHDAIYIQRTPNNELVLSSQKQTSSSETITRSADGICGEFLVFCYTKNKDKVIFKANPLSYAHKRDIRQVLEYLEGYEITSETDAQIEVSFVFKEMQVLTPVIVKRMLYLIKLQSQALISNDEKTLMDAEMSLNRLFYLGTRVLFRCMTDAKARSENEITSEEEIFFQQQLLKRLEHIGDRILRCTEVKPADRKQMIPLLAFVESVLLQKLSAIPDLKKSYDALKITAKDPTGNFHLHKLLDLCKDIFDVKLSIYLNSVVG